MTGRKVFSKQERFQIFERDNFTCQYCGRKPPEVQLEVDHIVPLAKGGTNDERNLITACRDCNRGKGIENLAATNDFFNMKPIKFSDIPQSAVKAQILFINYGFSYYDPVDILLKLFIDPSQVSREAYRKFNGKKVKINCTNYDDKDFETFEIFERKTLIFLLALVDKEKAKNIFYHKLPFSAQDCIDDMTEQFVGVKKIHKSGANKYWTKVTDLYNLKGDNDD